MYGNDEVRIFYLLPVLNARVHIGISQGRIGNDKQGCEEKEE
jgi:hypothetical protein